MRRYGRIKRILAGLLAVTIVLCTIPVQDVDAAKRGWKKKDGEKYYILSSGKKAVGSCRIKGKYYVFDRKGKLLTPKKKSLADVGKKSYYVNSAGMAVSGWQIINKKLYNVKQTGEIRKNVKYKGIVFTDTGAARECQDTVTMIQTVKTVNSVTKPERTKKQKLRACWKYMVSRKRFRYVSKYPDLNQKGWQRITAEDMLRTKKGNCYSFACAFAAMANVIGYDAYVICGRINGRRDRARDGLTRHAWVRIDGKNYDPEAHFAGWGKNIYGRKRYPVRRYTIQRKVQYWKY